MEVMITNITAGDVNLDANAKFNIDSNKIRFSKLNLEKRILQVYL